MSGIKRPIDPLTRENAIVGSWIVTAAVPGRAYRNISFFRGAPTDIGAMSFSDPFGPKSLTIRLPEVTYLESRGEGDLDWAVKGANIDITWSGPLPSGYPFGTTNAAGVTTPAFKFEGYIEAFTWDEGMTIQVKGAMLQGDNFLAKPEYPARPMSYEYAISRQFRNKPSLRLSPVQILWPRWWRDTYKPASGKPPSWEIPIGVSNGQKWTGLLTRSTGKWDPMLTGYIQGMLSTMYTHRGRWTLELAPSRRPVLLHRDNPVIGQNLVVINPIHPGVKISLSEDGGQAMTTLYGQGTSLSGVAYTGMNSTNHTIGTTYTPLASLRQAWPDDRENAWLDRTLMAREVMLQTQQGLDLSQAQSVARNHLARFADPGVTGTVVLKSDPTFNGKPIMRHLVRAGMNIQIPGVFGDPEGIIAHISESSHNIADDSVTLTIDTKARDALTVSEVRLRGRDSLQVPRMLVAGGYTPPVPDQLYPWSYAGGSGYVPSNDLYSSKRLFDGMSRTTRFPWTEQTMARPPSSSKWRSCYVRIPASTSQNANNYWASQSSPWGQKVAIPILMSQAATIRLIQIAAYKSNGEVYKVPFHVSLYYYGGVNYRSMPLIPSGSPLMGAPWNYSTSGKTQHHPFVPGGWEQYNADGTLKNPNIADPAAGAGVVRVWGTSGEKAGYWPGSMQGGGSPTGLLVDESQWSYDLRGAGDAVFNPYSMSKNLKNSHSGNLYMMIFCEDHTSDVYFAGRIFRVEPGGE